MPSVSNKSRRFRCSGVPRGFFAYTCRHKVLQERASCCIISVLAFCVMMLIPRTCCCHMEAVNPEGVATLLSPSTHLIVDP